MKENIITLLKMKKYFKYKGDNLNTIIEKKDNEMNELKEYSEITFESIRHIDEFGYEYWLARELQIALYYKKWQKFMNVIDNAKIACEQSKVLVDDHFTQVGKMVKIGSKTERKITDYKLTRYACYLIIQNADPKKEIVALSQTYFAV